MENKEIKISPLNKLGISLFFSIAFLSFIISLLFGLIDYIIYDHSSLDGTVYCYTSDSIYVDVKWEAEYKFIKLSEKDIFELDSIITSIMNKDIPIAVKNMDYMDYLGYKKNKIVFESKYTKVEIFKE